MINARIQRWLVLAQLAGALLVAWWLASRGWGWPVALLAGVALPPVAHALVMARHFVFSRQVSGAAPPAHRIGIGGLLRAWLVETGCSLRAFCWLQPFRARAPMPAPSAPPGPDAPMPVLLVHGYLCNRGCWLPLAPRLAARGHVVEALTMDPPFADIDDYAAQVHAAVEALAARTGSPRVALVGHSMGGLAVRAYLRAHGASRAARVVTLGTPHRGTVLAAFGIGRNARQMRRASPWLAELEAAEDASMRAMTTVVLTHQDNIVIPASEQTLPGARTVELSGVGHLALITDPRVGRLLEEVLAGGPDGH